MVFVHPHQNENPVTGIGALTKGEGLGSACVPNNLSKMKVVN